MQRRVTPALSTFTSKEIKVILVQLVEGPDNSVPMAKPA